MDLAQPLFPPPAGYRWVLQTNVEIFDGAGAALNLLNLPPTWNADHTLYISNFEGRTTHTNGANFSLAGAATYELGRWTYAQIQTYVDGSATELMAVSPDAGGVSLGAGSACININAGDAFRSYQSPPAVWPDQLTITYQTHSHDSVAGSIGAQLLKWVGDVWAALPSNDTLPEGESGTDCPPACTPNAGTGGGGLTPAEQAGLDAGLEVTWPRTNSRVDVAALDPGLAAALTYDDEWDGALPFLLDGYRLTLTALPHGGYTQRCEYRFTKFPGTDATGSPFWFTSNVHATGDTVHRTKP